MYARSTEIEASVWNVSWKQQQQQRKKKKKKKTTLSNCLQEQIEKDLEDVCSLLPGTLADECKQAVQKYAPQIIDMLIKKEDPKTVCTQLGICTGKGIAQFNQNH